ncbi:hypothetical protein OG762_34515 [Streptomyces sp. NBC_01136]|uniref:hypothetical protein n=1 Tax=unclassified Streptomyces TaxID=2593676 RepID=UPI0032433A8D|nr:hypothetical protein OG762_34515 [Streptomyces sp. NBC_01136]
MSKSPPESMQHHLRQRLNTHAQARWPQLARIDVRFRAGFAYGLLEYLEALNTTRRTVRYTVGWKITDDDEKAIARLPEAAGETSVH